MTGRGNVQRLDRTYCALALVLTAAVALAAPPPSLTRAGAARVSFEGRGAAGLRVIGVTQALELTQSASHLVLSVPLDTLQTGLALRDRHLRERYLETARFPLAQLSVPREALALPAEGGSTEGLVKGTLSLHGQTREVSVRWRATREPQRLHVRASLQLDHREFGIPLASYLGVGIQPESDVQATFELTAS